MLNKQNVEAQIQPRTADLQTLLTAVFDFNMYGVNVQ